jgi:hypothetical protein
MTNYVTIPCALLCLAMAASTPAVESTSTVEVIGYTETGEYVRLRGSMLGASYSSCEGGPCLDVVADQIVLAFDDIFSDGFDGAN